MRGVRDNNNPTKEAQYEQSYPRYFYYHSHLLLKSRLFTGYLGRQGRQYPERQRQGHAHK